MEVDASSEWKPSGLTLTDWVRHWSADRPTAVAFADESSTLTWADYDRISDGLAVRLMAADMKPGERLATVLPDGARSHLAWAAAEKAGLVAVGIGSQAGEREIDHLVQRSRSRLMLVDEGLPSSTRIPALDFGSLYRSAEDDRVTEWEIDEIDRRRLGPEDIWMLNSTSGTTGLPKLVTHTQRRWEYFHSLAVQAAGLGQDDVFCSAIPSPFGFGLWTAHFTPTFLGVPCFSQRRFSATGLIHFLQDHQVTVLAAVTTQLIMMLRSGELQRADLEALRVVFTGGEAVPYEQAAAFEDLSGATVLQFYGSNETGAASCTTLLDDRRRRLTTAGRVIPGMEVRLFDPETKEPIGDTGSGQPGCRGPAMCEGYWDDPAADRQLYTPDGWMLMGDLVDIDDAGWLTVIGRTSDIVIRGGKNISAPAIEAEVMTHPYVALAAAVAVPDPTFGERVGIYVQLQPGSPGIDLADLTDHLAARGVTRSWWPEHLAVLDELPRSSGGKVAKGTLREDAARRFPNSGE